jgi:ABC-type polysaccharide/polyol phosphate transport system ATPase subunit
VTAISLRGVSKQYVKYIDTPALLSQAARLFRGNRHSRLWAVRDLDLEIDEGSSVGIIGRNGSGKSTTLQMLAGVTAPTVGEVRVRGRIAPLISVGVGFHPELTGRENVFINAAILGLSSRETQQKYDSIVAFSGVEDFMDTPIKFYSSGMSVRLGFSVAAHSEPQVLLVDEVLAVGDLSFQLKCFEHMSALQEQGTTVIVVSHNLGAVQRLCSRTVVLHSSRMVFDGPTVDAISAYHEALASSPEQPGRALGEAGHEGDVLRVLSCDITDADGHPTRNFGADDQVLRLRTTVVADQAVDKPSLLVTVSSADGVSIYRENNVLSPFPSLVAGRPTTWTVDVHPALPTGSYAASVSVVRGLEGATTKQELVSDLAVLAQPPAMTFAVMGRPMVRGVADLRGRFAVDDRDKP